MLRRCSPSLPRAGVDPLLRLNPPNTLKSRYSGEGAAKLDTRAGEKIMSDKNGSSSTSLRLKTGLAEMLKGGVIMDVTDARQAEIAEKAGAVAVMALERVPAQIRAEGGVARMASPKKIREIMEAVSIQSMW